MPEHVCFHTSAEYTGSMPETIFSSDHTPNHGTLVFALIKGNGLWGQLYLDPDPIVKTPHGVDPYYVVCAQSPVQQNPGAFQN